MEDDTRTLEEKEKKLKELAEDIIPYTVPKKKNKEKVKQPIDEETVLSKMSPAQKEQLEKMKALYEERVMKIRFKANLRNQQLQKKAAKRAKAAKVARKQRKVNRRRK
jgi:hypothetical protein